MANFGWVGADLGNQKCVHLIVIVKQTSTNLVVEPVYWDDFVMIEKEQRKQNKKRV